MGGSKGEKQAELKTEGVPEVEAPRVQERCRFFDECLEARKDRLCCRSGIYSELCEEYKRRLWKVKKLLP